MLLQGFLCLEASRSLLDSDVTQQHPAAAVTSWPQSCSASVMMGRRGGTCQVTLPFWHHTTASLSVEPSQVWQDKMAYQRVTVIYSNGC